MVDLQSTNRTKLSKVRETTFSITPSNPVFTEQRNTSSGLNANPQTIVSNEIRSDRQRTDLILVGLQSGGPIAGELSFKAFDEDWEEAVQGTWDTRPYIENLVADTQISDVSATTLTVASGLGTPFKTGMVALMEGFGTSANNRLARVASSSSTTVVFPASTFTAEASVPLAAKARVIGFQGASGDLVATVTSGNALTSTSLDFTTLGIDAGDWVKIGDGTAGNSFANDTDDNGWARVSAIAAQRLSFDIVPSGWGADAGTGKTLMVFYGDRLVNGSTKRSNTFERQYLDHSPASYEYFTGQTLNVMTVNLGVQNVVPVTKEYIGSAALISASRPSGVSDVAAPTYPNMNSSSDVGDISIDGATITGPNFVTAATLNLNNNLRNQNAIGSLGAVGIGNGEFAASLTQFTTYFGDKALYDKMLAGTEFGFSTRIKSPSTNHEAYIIDLPRCQFATGAPSVDGKNADVMLSGSVEALMHNTLGYTIGIHRFWYLPA